MINFNLRNLLVVFADMTIIVASPIIGGIIRLGSRLALKSYAPQIVAIALIALVAKPLVFSGFGLYRILWKYAEVREYRRLIVACITSSFAVALLVGFASFSGLVAAFPISLLSLDWLISLLGVLGLRLLMRQKRMLNRLS